ncbi:MAG: rRNA maturation RNase YbeY [Pseudomonadales bacterium]
MRTIELQLACPLASVPSPNELESWIASVTQALELSGDVCVRVVDEQEGSSLNARYRDRPDPTNVLSFPMELPPGVEAAVLGDLAICAPVVEREAQEQGKDVKAHWAHMVVHGILHLAGHGHETEAQAQAMEALEVQLLGAMGFSNPYQLPCSNG